LVVEDVQLTKPAAGEVLVKVEACGVCHSDTIPQAYGLNGKLYVSYSKSWWD
jgi:Zn-dependent alcohol dehydrogenase